MSSDADTPSEAPGRENPDGSGRGFVFWADEVADRIEAREPT